MRQETDPAVKRVALYARVSTEEQAKKGYSLEAQIESLKRFCKKNQRRYCRVYKDNGHSGTSLDRPKLQMMLDHAYHGLFEEIIVWKIDRLSRSMRDLIELVEYFKACNVAVKSVTEPFDLNTPIGECVFNMMGNFAQLEHKTMIERINLGLRRRWEQGKWKGGVPPYGYDYNKKTERLEVKEEEAKIVKKIFTHYLRRKSLRLVTNYLNTKKMPPRNGTKWRDSTVGVILSRKTYVGILKIGDVVNTLPELRIVSKRTFEKVQELRKRRRTFKPRIRNEESFMEGGMFCHNCGTTLFMGMRYCPECGVKQMTSRAHPIGQQTSP